MRCIRESRSSLALGTFLFAVVLLSPLADSKAAGARDPQRGFLGAELQAEGDRARVMSIVPGGPAAKAGLTKGDLIEAFNGARFRFASDRELIEGMTWICAGRPVRLAVRRGDRTREIVIIPRLATTEELRALSRWVEQQKRLEEMVRRQRAEENFEAMVRQAPIDITLRRTAKGFEITSLVLLPQDLDLKNAFVNGLMDALRVGDEVTLRYSWENARNAERIDVILKPSYVDLEVIVERTTHPRERSKP